MLLYWTVPNIGEGWGWSCSSVITILNSLELIRCCFKNNLSKSHSPTQWRTFILADYNDKKNTHTHYMTKTIWTPAHVGGHFTRLWTWLLGSTPISLRSMNEGWLPVSVQVHPKCVWWDWGQNSLQTAQVLSHQTGKTILYEALCMGKISICAVAWSSLFIRSKGGRPNQENRTRSKVYKGMCFLCISLLTL